MSEFAKGGFVSDGSAEAVVTKGEWIVYEVPWLPAELLRRLRGGGADEHH